MSSNTPFSEGRINPAFAERAERQLEAFNQQYLDRLKELEQGQSEQVDLRKILVDRQKVFDLERKELDFKKKADVFAKASLKTQLKELEQLKLLDTQRNKIVASIKNEAGQYKALTIDLDKYRQALKAKNPNQEQKRILDAVAGTVATQAAGQKGVGDVGAAGLAGAGLLGGLLGGKGGHGAGGMLTHAAGHKLGIPFLGSLLRLVSGGNFGTGLARIAGISTVVELINKITGFNLATPVSEFRTALQSGRITGQGAGAGLASKFHAVGLGLNPFDLISNATAQAIITGVRSQGFQDKFAMEMSDTVGEVVNRLGIDWKDALQLATDAVRQGNMSLIEFRSSMEDIGHIAHATKTSVADLTQSLIDLNKFAVETGGATGVAQASVSTETFASVFGNVAGLGKAGGGLIAGAAKLLAPMMGVPSIMAGTGRGQQAALMALDRLLPEVVRLKPPGMTMDDWAVIQKNGGYLSAVFPTATVSQIAGMLKHYEKPGAKTFAQQIRETEAMQAVKNAQDERKFHPQNQQIRKIPTRAGIVTIKTSNVLGQEKAYVSGLEDKLSQLGVAPSEIADITRPLRQAYGNKDAFKHVEGQTRTKVVLELKGDAGKLFRAWIDGNDYNQGKRPSNKIGK